MTRNPIDGTSLRNATAGKAGLRPKALTDEGASVAQGKSGEQGQEMSRDGFLKKIIRIGLLAILSLISVVLAGRVAFDKCSGCPGNGFCNGETDCNKY